MRPSTDSAPPSMSDDIPVVPYRALRDQVEGILSEGKLHTRQSSEWEKVVTYWHIGDALMSHIDGQPRADYGERVVPTLSRDSGLSLTLLWDIPRFRRCLASLPTHRQLTWSHFKVVAYLPTQAVRRFYLQAASRDQWSVRQLREAIDADTYGQATTQPLAVPMDQDPNAGRPLRRPLHVPHCTQCQPRVR